MERLYKRKDKKIKLSSGKAVEKVDFDRKVDKY